MIYLVDLSTRLLFILVSYVLWIILYAGVTVLALQKYRKRRTKLSLVFALTIFATTILIISLLGETYILQSGAGFDTNYKIFALSSLWSQCVIFFFLYVMANTFFFKWPIKSEWLLTLYYGVLLLIETIGIYNNFGWQIYCSGTNMLPDFAYQILLYGIPFVIVIFLSIKFFFSAKQITNLQDTENKRAIQLLSLGYLIYNAPFLTLFLTAFTGNPIIYVLVTLIILNAPVITYMLLYIGFYRPAWFKRMFEKETWISSVLR